MGTFLQELPFIVCLLENDLFSMRFLEWRVTTEGWEKAVEAPPVGCEV